MSTRHLPPPAEHKPDIGEPIWAADGSCQIVERVVAPRGDGRFTVQTTEDENIRRVVRFDRVRGWVTITEWCIK